MGNLELDATKIAIEEKLKEAAVEAEVQAGDVLVSITVVTNGAVDQIRAVLDEAGFDPAKYEIVVSGGWQPAETEIAEEDKFENDPPRLYGELTMLLGPVVGCVGIQVPEAEKPIQIQIISDEAKPRCEELMKGYGKPNIEFVTVNDITNLQMGELVVAVTTALEEEKIDMLGSELIVGQRL